MMSFKVAFLLFWGMGHSTKEHVELVDIKGINKKAVLDILFEHAILIIDYADNRINENDIKWAKKRKWRIGYMKGRPLLVNLSKNRFNAYYYNQANGQNAAQEAISELREQKITDELIKSKDMLDKSYTPFNVQKEY